MVLLGPSRKMSKWYFTIYSKLSNWLYRQTHTHTHTHLYTACKGCWWMHVYKRAEHIFTRWVTHILK